MNKFNIILLSAGVALSAGLASCSESFLDVDSKTQSNTENFYKTEADAWRALVGCYDGWRQISSAPEVGFYVASTVMSDETYGATGVSDNGTYQVIDHFDPVYAPSAQMIYKDDWKRYYAGVYRCNELITRAGQINWLSEETGSLYLGEARALRALLYFDMVRLWGNIPLYLEPVNENREQAPAAEVYDAIVGDLVYAADNIPASANRAENENGRVSRAAAQAMLARVYLYYSGYYGSDPAYTDAEGNSKTFTKADALAAAEDVIANGGYSLLPEFKNLWPAASLVPIPGNVGWNAELSTYAGDANSEVILAQKFTPTQDYSGNNDSNRWQVMLGMRSLNATPYGKGWGACTISTPYLSFFEEGDERYTASVIDLEAEGIAGSADWTNSVNDWLNYTGYTVKKYSPLCYGNGLPGTNADGTAGFQECNSQQWTIMRLADVLLMAAELGSPNASEYLHRVRNRAGLPDIAATRENILAERARELAFEGIRYWDLLRQGVETAADAIAASAGPCLDGGIQGTVQFSRDRVIATQGLSQIPLDQITLSNGVLKQNPGWR